ncbi:D-Ala-D-Ala carboxypeptidase family metallohydrolase [Oscillatoria sp. CS-180]|uniref:D-Ala-D-Ala carboxypeptidase family metallohydrolase n=1 Tax=Oscillatoria sp. CS-180 TaxID=3021720 RepID=UPI0023315871|nr:D-Ala-D-Ala carboxypeptidase family metallohydrolase [Oscillatoria sp. CS-180]MDB9525986.1 D-Ala-D-Ala carboxypeptidase family metallohydrolase [Oscillatoria sp. CS-180]
MGTWIKETDKALYLMDGGYYIDSIPKRPSTTNPKEQIANIEALKAWFRRADKPRRMTVSVGTGAPEPAPIPATDPQPVPPMPESRPSESGAPEHDGMRIKIIGDTFFKRSLKNSSQLSDQDKVQVRNGQTFDIEYYTDVGQNHWLVELLEPTVGDRQTTSWYVFAPHVELITAIRLTVISDTLFKHEPKLSIDLPASAKKFVGNGTQLMLFAYEPAAGNHTKIQLANTIPNLDKTRPWYAFAPDIRIRGQHQVLQVISDTLFKARPVQSIDLADSDKVFVRNKTIFWVQSYSQPENLHIRVALQGAFLGPQNRNTWYCFIPDIRILGSSIGDNLYDPDSRNRDVSSPTDRGVPLQFPGFEGTYFSNDPIYFETQYGDRGHFTWGQALHADAETGFYRRPENANVVYNILDMAKVMEDIQRRYANKPIQITSWYRDPETNAAIGGASQSRHMAGDAVDFVVPGVHPYDVYADLNPWWGNRGGLASSTVFTHIDMRGYGARWDYGY